MTWIVPVSSKGQITLPKAVRLHLGVQGPQGMVAIQQKKTEMTLSKASPYSLNDLYGIAQRKDEKSSDLEKLINQGVQKMARRVAKEGVA